MTKLLRTAVTALSLLVLSALSCSAAEAPAGAPAAPSEVTVVCFGDSITEGNASSDPATKSYPAVLQVLLDEKHGPGAFRVINAGISGEDTRQGLARLDALLEKTGPDWVLVGYGTNDMWEKHAVSVPETKSNTMEILRRIKASGASCIITTLPPLWEMDEEVAERIASVTAAAKEMEVPLLDLNTIVKQAISEAGGLDKKSAWEKYYAAEWTYIHPNDFGYAFLARQWCDALEAQMAKTSPGKAVVVP